MTDKLREAAQQALEALNQVDNCTYINDYGDAALSTTYESGMVDKAITALRAALAQQDAQAVPESLRDLSAKYIAEDEAAESSINRLMTLGRKMADAISAAPTPPAQRVTLTPDEIERLWYPSAVIAEPGTRRMAFGRAVIEAYERKNGISQTGYTAADMASQGASQFRAGHDAAQSEIAELEQENRLLRARNDRLQKEIEQKGER